jgi:hypothetical protein
MNNIKISNIDYLIKDIEPLLHMAEKRPLIKRQIDPFYQALGGNVLADSANRIMLFYGYNGNYKNIAEKKKTFDKDQNVLSHHKKFVNDVYRVARDYL